MWVFIPKIHTKISNKSITMQKFELVAFKNSKLCSVKPSNNVSEWGSDKPRYRAAITDKNVQTRHAVGNFCIRFQVGSISWPILWGYCWCWFPSDKTVQLGLTRVDQCQCLYSTFILIDLARGEREAPTPLFREGEICWKNYASDFTVQLSWAQWSWPIMVGGDKRILFSW